MIIREAVRDDLPAIVGLLHEDVIREVDESQVPPEAYADAFDEITSDAHQQLLVGVLDGEVRVELTTNAQRVRAQEFYRELGFVASHVGMKLYLGGRQA